MTSGFRLFFGCSSFNNSLGGKYIEDNKYVKQLDNTKTFIAHVAYHLNKQYFSLSFIKTLFNQKSFEVQQNPKMGKRSVLKVIRQVLG